MPSKVPQAARAVAGKGKLPAVAAKYDVDEHLLSLYELQRRYPQSRIDAASVQHSPGLTDAEAKERLRAEGLNALSRKRKVIKSA